MKVTTSFSYETSSEEEVQIQQNAGVLVQNLLVPFIGVLVRGMEKSLDLNTSTLPGEDVVIQNRTTLFTKGGCPNKSDPKPGSKPEHKYEHNWAEGIE